MSNSYGTATAFTSSAAGLANDAFAYLGTIDFGNAPPHECFVEILVIAGATPSGNKQLVVYAASSINGADFSDAPSGATTDNTVRLGTVALPDVTTRRGRAMPISPLFGGALPPKVSVYVKNEAGVSITAVGQYRTETFG